ncbi:MAG: PAS domain S-box protein [Anaerolineales bacterium]|nr:PAS domain S-box protein [Anaerolineales bacterium]
MRYARNQRLLNEITTTALETPDLYAMLDIVMRKLSEVLRADGYYVTLWNGEDTNPRLAAISVALQESFDNLKVGSDSQLFSHAILDAGKALIIEDMTDTPYAGPDMASQFPGWSALGLPLIANNQKLGTVIICYNQRHLFIEDETELAQQAANQIALAVAKSNLDMETHSKAVELASLYTAAQDMASSLLDPPALLTKLARHMTDALKVTSSNIMAVNLSDATMEVVAEYWSSEAAPLETQSDLGRVYANSDYATIMQFMLDGQVLILHADDDKLTSIEKNQFTLYDVKSMMFVPIMAHGQLLGDIELWESSHRREFTAAEIRLAQAMAGHAAGIIENSTLFAITRQRESELGALLRVARAVSSSLQLSDVLMQAATTLSRLLRVDYCSLSDYLPDQNGIMTTALFSSDEDVSGPGDIGHFFSLDEYPTTLQVLESGQSTVIRLDDPNADPSEIKQLQRDKMFTSLLIPLRLRGRSLGLAELFSSDPQRNFKPEEVQFASALADQVAVAVENARLYEKREQQEAYFRALIENSAEGVAIFDAQGIVRYIAPSEERLTGYLPEEIQGQTAFRYIHPQDLLNVLDVFKEGVATPGAVRTVEYRLQRKDGEWRHFEITGHNMLDDLHINGVVANYRDITERKKAEWAVKESQSRLEAIVSTALNGIITIDNEHKVVLFNPSAERIFGYSAEETLGQSLNKLIPERYHGSHSSYVEAYGISGNSSRKKGLLDSLYGRRANGEEFPMEAFISSSEVNGKRFYTVIFQDITERRQAEDALKESERKFRALAENIPSVVYQCQNDSKYTFIYLNDSIEQLTGYSKAEFLSTALSFVDLYHPEDLKYIPIPDDLNKEHINQSPFHITYRIRHKDGHWVWVDEWGTGVLDAQGQVQYLEGVMIDITERKRSEEGLRRHAMELETLAVATSALRTAQNVTEMLPILARQALRAVNATYASIFLLEPETGEFVSRGWYSVGTQPNFSLSDESNLRHFPNMGITGRVAATGEIYMSEDIQKDPVLLVLDGERERLKDVHGSVSLPLRAQEKIIGVMHIWSTECRIFSDTEIRLLIALAETASNSIHRAILFEQTLQHAQELALAYDNTLEGWARALELRDEITEGHTRRVTELTLKLARALNIPENEIVHVRRGALLHDIGKMGIPDSILHKPGPFTAQERMIMQQHTQYARDMLASISFLQPAIDIPYCHHEHWDGAGYPRGLKGKEIPLAARAFSIIDVWDALTSDRPYRPAWTKEKTRDYILERSGKQFDPQVIEVFFSLVLDET